MRGVSRRIAEGQSHGALANARRQRRDTRGPRLVPQQTLDPRPHEPLLPAPHRNFACAGLAHDLVRAQAIHRQQHDPRSPDVLLRAVSIGDDRLQARPIGRAHLDCDPLAHAHPLSAAGAYTNSGFFCSVYTTLISAFPSSRRVNSWLSLKRLLWAVLGRARGAAVVTTVDRTLMRGLGPHDR